MKKIITVILLLLYTTFSFGIGVKQMYCCGKLSKAEISFITIQAQADECCGTNSMNDLQSCDHTVSHEVSKSACCSEKYQLIKLTNDESAANAFDLRFAFFTQLLATLSPISLPIISYINLHTHIVYDVPIDNVPIFKFIRVFLI